MFETCVEIRAQFSEYLDAVSDRESLRAIRYHLRYCEPCSRELESYQRALGSVRSLPRRRVPPELALRLRVRLSQELHRNFVSRMLVHLENSLRPLLVPASGGVLTAVICFGLIMGTHVAQVQVNSLDDVPLTLTTPARIRQLGRVDLPVDGQVVVITQIDSGGRVLGYQVLSGEETPELLTRLDHKIYFSLFDPATTFGRPTGGQVILTLRRITIRG